MNIGEVVVIQKDNPYHEWNVRETARRLKIPIKRAKWTERDISRFRYSGILDEKEVIWLEVGKQSPFIKDELKRMKVRKRLVVIEVETREQRNWIQKIEMDGKLPKILPPVITWEEKEEACVKMLGQFRAVCKSAEVQKRLIGMMIRDTESWSDVRLTVELANREGNKLDLDTLQNIYPDMEFYRLDDWVQDVMEGKKKKKTIKVAHYFRHIRGYSNVWLMQKIRERVEQVALVYDAYRKGIIFVDLTKTEILERSKVMGWDKGDALATMKPAERRACLKVVNELPYTYFIKVQKVLFSGSEIVGEDWDIYRYIEQLRVERGLHDASNTEGETKKGKWKRR